MFLHIKRVHRHSSCIYILCCRIQLFLSPMNCFSDFEMFWESGKSLVPTIVSACGLRTSFYPRGLCTKLVAARANWSSENNLIFFSYGLSSRLILLVFDYLLLLFVFQFRDGFFSSSYCSI